MRHNSRLFLVGVLVIVFPLLFVWITQSFFSTAYSNIATAEKQRVGILHDATAALLSSGVSAQELSTFIETVASENVSITKFKIVTINTEDDFIVTHSIISDEVGTAIKSRELFFSADSTPNNSLIFEFQSNGDRTWQVFRKVTIEKIPYYIFTEHSFAAFDSVMLARQQQSYMALTVIFIFLITLAIWLSRQIHWQVEYRKLDKKLEEQMLFSNTIAHELRAPLTAIKGYASFIDDSGELQPENRKYLENIQTSAERLVVLINDFLEVARIQSGKLKLEVTDVRLFDVVTSVVTEQAANATAKGLKITTDLSSNNILLHTDKNRLQQILTNIVSNAIKYTDNGSIAIFIEQKRHTTTVKVKDTGNGISAADQKKLFSPFVRVGNAEASKVTGTGLGMWITKKLVEQLDGIIEIESIEGVGTHVKITFHQ